MNDVLKTISDIVWGAPLLVLLVGVGAFLTIRLRGVQLTKFGTGLRYSFGARGEQARGEGDVSHYQSLMTSLAAMIGIGNIVGVSTAISIGGPGALFWMWVIAILGMATKYAEGLLAVKFRTRDENGNILGGPMVYIERGLGLEWKWLGVCFAIFGAIAAFGIGNMVQANAVAENVSKLFESRGGVSHWITGGVLAILTGLVVVGGIQSIAKTASVLVPFMAIFYLSGCLWIVGAHIADVPAALATICKSAFTGSSAAGGFTGASILMAMRMGVARGVFSNEAGLGSSPMASAAAETDEPVEQGVVSMTGVFLDTIVVCTLTGLALVLTGVWTEGADAAAGMAQSAFELAVHPQIGKIVVGVGVITFAYSTIVGWAYYGERCVGYLFGARAIFSYRVCWVAGVMVGAVGGLQFVWNVADILSAFMAVPNLIALIALSGVVAAETKRYWR